MVLGSVAEKVVRESDVPVLLVTAGESASHA
jgi:nucleotide-binding universal stress UspA family protein